jgi:Polyketide cyclase / dehydrase and lipid transport
MSLRSRLLRLAYGMLATCAGAAGQQYPQARGVPVTRPWLTSGSVERVIDAPAQRLYDLVSDVTSTGERSTECHRVEWLAGDHEPTVGSRFRGHNRSRLARWSRTCEIIEAEPGRVFAFRTVPTRLDPSRRDSTTWRYELLEDGDRTLVRHSYEITWLPSRPFRALYGVLLPQHRDMRPAMQHTLDALAETVEGDRSER